MKEEVFLDMYTKEIIKCGSNVDKIKMVLRIMMENTERECSSKASSLAYDIANKLSRLKAWDSE